MNSANALALSPAVDAVRSFIGGASDCAKLTPLISPLAGFHDRQWIVGFGIDPANPQVFRLMKRGSSVIYLFSIYYCTLYRLSERQSVNIKSCRAAQQGSHTSIAWTQGSRGDAGTVDPGSGRLFFS